MPYRGLELLGVHQVAAVAVDRDDRRLRATELGAQCRGEGEAEAAEIERGEKRARPRETQSIVSVGRSGSGVERDDRLRREHATKLRIDPLRLHRLRREPFLGGQSRLALSPQGLGFTQP